MRWLNKYDILRKMRCIITRLCTKDASFVSIQFPNLYVGSFFVTYGFWVHTRIMEFSHNQHDLNYCKFQKNGPVNEFLIEE